MTGTPLARFRHAAAIAYALAIVAAFALPAAAADRPRLVVAILLDQYREDYLDRFRPVFGKGGFMRLIDGGARFRDCNIPYAQTWTGPGHATWLSGTVPAVHGVVGNSWFDRGSNWTAEAAGDSTVRSIGLADSVYGEPASPHWLRAETVADVLDRTTAGETKIFAVSDKARGAVLPSGQHADGVYWLDRTTGLMQTSTYYAETLPDWVRRENEARRPKVHEAWRTPWTPSLPASAFRNTIVIDTSDTFPHSIRRPGEKAGSRDVDLALHPFALAAIFDFAETTIVENGMGVDKTPDLLIISVSVTDRVGHRYGPDSPEVLDLAHRLDARLASFFSFLDTRVGPGRWTLQMTADHGVAPSGPAAKKLLAGSDAYFGAITTTMLHGWIDRVLPRGLAAAGVLDAAHRAQADSTRRWARFVGSGFVTFDDAKLKAVGVSRAAAARVIADSARTNPWIAEAYTDSDLAAEYPTGLHARQAKLGFFSGRSGDVVLIPREYAYFGGGSTERVSHGTPYHYDTNVPCVFYGAGVKRTTVSRPVSTLDIAPTVAKLLGVPAPAQNRGRVLTEALAPTGSKSR